MAVWVSDLQQHSSSNSRWLCVRSSVSTGYRRGGTGPVSHLHVSVGSEVEPECLPLQLTCSFLTVRGPMEGTLRRGSQGCTL
jgi:hypothetical protein